MTIKALHNTGVERTAELHITGAGFDRKVTVVQEDGQVRIDGVELEGMDMPSPDDYLSALQKDGKPLGADEIYKETWLWLKERGCERLVNKRLLESYSEAFARYIQCSEAVSKYGMLGKHPTTGAAIASPFTQLLMNFQKQANLLWYEIYDIVKQNCTEPFEGSPQDSVMEQLLRSRRNM